jgi:thiamine kinase-like enzyme
MIAELIKGNSGCSLDLIKINEKNIIRKSTKDKSYIERLEKQCIKQNEYRSDQLFVKIPTIINKEKSADMFMFDMEYIFAQDAIRFLEDSTIKSIDIFIENIITVIDDEINNSNMINMQKSIFYNKIKEVEKNIIKKGHIIEFDYFIKKIYSDLLSIKDSFLIPIGICHGDLTLSNILISNKKLILIDFLDTFIETPLQDIVKIRQDTKHFWSFNMMNDNCDITKLEIILQYMDAKIVNHFSKYKFIEYYEIFQILNLLRIVPYATDDKIIHYLKKELNNIQGIKCQKY